MPSSCYLSSRSSPDTNAFRVLARVLCSFRASGDFKLGILCKNAFFMQFIFIYRTAIAQAPYQIQNAPAFLWPTFQQWLGLFGRFGEYKNQLKFRGVVTINNKLSMEQKQKEETLRKYVQGLYLTDRETGALNALCELARWFGKERREERFMKLLKSEFSKARPSQSKTLIRTLYLIDKLIKQYRSFRQPAALVITQIFVELFSIFFQTGSIREMQQMKKLRKRWVTILPDEVLIKIKRQIENQFKYNLDSGFSDKITQQLKEYYTKQLKLTPQQIAKYLPENNQPKPQRRSRSRDSSLSYEEPTKRSDPYKRQPEQYGEHLMPPGPVLSQPMPQPTQYQQMPMAPMGYGMPPHDPYAKYGYPDQNPMGQGYPPMYPGPYQMPHTMNKQPPGGAASRYMVYPPAMPGYPPNYYMGGYPMEQYYQNPQPQYYGMMGAVAGNGGGRMEEMRKQPFMNPNPSSSTSTPGSTTQSTVKNKSNSEGSVLEKLKELRLGSYRCPRCGLQSSSRDSFDFHLKSHFQQMKRSYDLSKKSKPDIRSHLLSMEAWVALASKASDQEYILEMSRATDPVCRLCSNVFKPVWDASLEKWVYRNVVNVQMDHNKSLVTLHFSCYNALRDEETPNQSDAVNG